MKRERLFYLDFIRAIATILILFTHYNAVFLYTNPQQLDKIVWTYRICNLYIGDFAVALFFIISGASLMYVYEGKYDLKKYYFKRWKSIYPMFWIGYIQAAIMRIVLKEYFWYGIPKVNFIYTILGFDGFVAGVKPTFYLVGEWFIGTIVLIYLIFPLLKLGIEKQPIPTIAGCLLIYALVIVCYQTPFTKAVLPFTRVPEVLLGMYFVKYIKKVKWPVALVSLVVLILNTIFKPSWNSSIQTTYVGIASFFVLVFIGELIKCKPLSWICNKIGKYSYAIFICHHIIIWEVMNRQDLYGMSVLHSYKMFAVCLCIIIPSSIALYWINEGVSKGVSFVLRKIRKKPEQIAES